MIAVIKLCTRNRKIQIVAHSALNPTKVCQHHDVVVLHNAGQNHLLSYNVPAKFFVTILCILKHEFS